MKKLSLAVVLFIPALLFADSPKTIQSTVAFTDAQNNALANGFLILDLSQNASVTSGGGQVVPKRVSITLDANGKIPANTTIWANDQITPSGTTYKATVSDSTNSNSFVLGNWSISGTSPIDVSQIVATSTGASYPTAILAAPSADQTISQHNLIISNNLTVSGNATVSGAATFSGNVTATAGQNIATLYNLDNIILVDGNKYANLLAAMQAASANTTVVVPSAQSYSGDNTFTTAGLQVLCLNNATITFAQNARIQFTGNNQGMEGCTLVGVGVGTATLQTVVFSGTNQFFRRNKYSGFGSTGGNGQIEVINPGAHFEFTQNSTQPIGNADTVGDLFINNCCSSNATMTDFRIENNDLGEVIIHATTSGTVIRKVIVTGNTYKNGQNSKTEFCEEIGVFGGSQVLGIVSAGNTCEQGSNTANGGFSFSNSGAANSVMATETGDTFNANGFTYAISPFEHVKISNSTITGNTANILNAQTGAGDGFTCDRCTSSSFTGNVINGWGQTAGSAGFHVNVSNTSLPSSSDNTIVGNVLIFPTAGTAGIGFWEQCNATASTCLNNTYAANHVLGPGSTGTGLQIEQDTGTISNAIVEANHFTNLANGVNQVGTRNGIVILPNKFAAVTTQYAGSLTGSSILDFNQGFTGLSFNTNGFWATLTNSNTGNRTYTLQDTTATSTVTIANSTAAMTTAAITTLNCGTTVTVSAPGVTTTDIITFVLNAAPSAPNGSLILQAWPTANNVNFAYCNPTAGSITPVAATLNWRVVR